MDRAQVLSWTRDERLYLADFTRRGSGAGGVVRRG